MSQTNKSLKFPNREAEEEPMTIDHCPETDGEHEPDTHGICRWCDFSASRGEWWDHFRGGP